MFLHNVTNTMHCQNTYFPLRPFLPCSCVRHIGLTLPESWIFSLTGGPVVSLRRFAHPLQPDVGHNLRDRQGEHAEAESDGEDRIRDNHTIPTGARLLNQAQLLQQHVADPHAWEDPPSNGIDFAEHEQPRGQPKHPCHA